MEVGSTGTNLDFISVAAALSLTTWSESTMRRRIAEGTVTRRMESCANGRAMVDFASIRPHVVLPLDDTDLALIKAADDGAAWAQSDLALHFLFYQQPKAGRYWLELAAKQNFPSAMYFLGRCYTDGIGVVKNENEGLIWILRAAVLGDPVAAAQMQHVRDTVSGASR
ncbi:tetratricopeptide repeat protein [Massilia sp. CF038]|uniref:tetratricopeptide repeat protein n=1 Tax=Massilia sp. CF038 TaxID=1881045 RepID=UPI00091AF29D|nr:tetratricopeptide repeat protein [Massilia sp. CF038]SHH52623.1 Sel1 repeat-containing protein [Massilia sp. CF038]